MSAFSVRSLLSMFFSSHHIIVRRKEGLSRCDSVDPIRAEKGCRVRILETVDFELRGGGVEDSCAEFRAISFRARSTSRTGYGREASGAGAVVSIQPPR